MFAIEVLQVVEELRLMSVMAETHHSYTTVGDGRGAAAQRPDSKCTLLHISFSRLDPTVKQRV